MATTAPAENEIGHGNWGLVPWSAFSDVTEPVPELTFPNSIDTYARMRADAQIASLLLGFTLPIRRYQWYIDDNGARDEVVEFTAANLNLPIKGYEDAPVGRRRDRFSHDRHLFHALLELTFGMVFFEQVYRFDEGTKRFHLRKLAPRMPGTIAEIGVARDGGLEFIKQFPSGLSGAATNKNLFAGSASVPIPVNRLVAYVNDQEGGNWFGQSMLRALYKHWLRKDRLLRVDAINIERNGAGVPMAYAPPNASKAEIEALGALARSYKVGESSGGALPNGADLRFKGVEGTMPKAVDSIRYDDEQMTGRFLAQFSQLGTTQSGNRALGETLMKFFSMAQEAVAKHYADVTNEHVIEDLVDINWSIDESAPRLCFEADNRFAISDIAELVKCGALTPDATLEEYLRAEGGVPKLEDNGGQPSTPPQSKPPANRRLQIKNAMTVGSRTLRRNPLPQEVKASVDWDAMEQAWTSARAALVDDWKTQVKAAQIDALVQAIENAETLEQLAVLEAEALGEGLLGDAMFAMAEEAGGHAVAEAAAQGVELDPFDSELVADEIVIRASAQSTVMARSISQTASSKAIALGGSGLVMDEIAARVREHLEGLSDSYLEDQLGGTLMQAQNSARRTVFGQTDSGTIYSSELLDGNTCIACKSVDGKQYESMEEAVKDYPAGGLWDCLGGMRCRGTLVFVASTETPASA